jgi:DNA-binding CsgD family transcriptional regulator
VGLGGGWQDLTERESAVLAAVERRLTNAEIAAEFVISIRTVESHIAALRRKLGVDSRPDLIAVAQSRRARSVPLPQNSFVGRETDVAAVRSLLGRRRWVTIVGPAGCGKTRLALEVAARQSTVPVLVELEHAEPGEVVGALSHALGLGAGGLGNVVAACAVALDTHPYVVLLDNADRVAESVAALVRELLALAGSLSVLATSR